MENISLYFIALPLLMILFAGTWLFQRVVLRGKDAGIVDVVWGLSFSLMAGFFAVMVEGDMARKLLIFGMVTIWAVRLAWHIHSRNHGKGEDTRYQRMRVDFGDKVQLWFFVLYQIQALAAWVLSVGIFVLIQSNEVFDWMDPWLFVGVLLFMIALSGESIADHQLAAFKKDPKNQGQVCRQGLWAYSRHPNYFFECLVWSSYIFMGFMLPWGWMTFVSPVVLLFLLTCFSGIPNNEAQNLRSKSELYRHYQTSVSAFIPWFPKANGTV